MADRKLKQQIDALWEQLRGIINASYKRQRETNTLDEADIADALRDFSENQSMNDALLSLLDREAADEVRHRKFTGVDSAPISRTTSAKLLIIVQVAQGARLLAMPSALSFLLLRKTAAEARVLGFIIRHDIPAEWLVEAASLDYSKIMNPA